MAHERLAIVDVEHGAQPLMTVEKDYILCVNGEIYNHKQLRAGLKKPATFLTDSDCECILHLYKEHGPSFLDSMNGIFAFVLLDETNDSFIAARDHMGICPLYLGRDADGAIWIASELKALADLCVTFEDFSPGHYYDSKTDKYVQWYKPTWWDPEWIPSPDLPLNTKAIREGLEAAVKRQLMSDVPYGVLLSGGLDSSLVASIASRICAKRIEDDSKTSAWWPRLHTFSIGLKESPDLKMARKVADYLGTVHHQFIFTVQEGLDALSDVIYHLETYDVTTCRAATPMYLMSRKIKAMGVKMVLSGEGSDEIFGGYLYFHKAPNREELHRETVRKLKDLYKFDCLRANKSTAAFGVEARVPFLDKEFMEVAMTETNPTHKLCGRAGGDKMEKWLLREAFKGYLPDEILWRQKEQFSDGVGYSWIDGLKALAAEKVSDADFGSAKYRFPHNTPPTKEAYMIRSIFQDHFPQRSAALCVPGGPSVACSTATAIAWDESFKKFADCSGRSIIGVHNSAYNEQERQAQISKGVSATGSSATTTNGTGTHAAGKGGAAAASAGAESEAKEASLSVKEKHKDKHHQQRDGPPGSPLKKQRT